MVAAVGAQLHPTRGVALVANGGQSGVSRRHGGSGEQLNDHIARNILKQPPHSCNYAGNHEFGAFLRRMVKSFRRGQWSSITGH
jgi:hypothetical protein